MGSSSSHRDTITEGEPEVVSVNSEANMREIMRRSQNAQDCLETDDPSYIDLLLHAYQLTTDSKRSVSRQFRRTGLRAVCYWLSNTLLFRCLFAFLIVLNVILLAVEADARVYQVDHPEDSGAYTAYINFMTVAEHFFTAAFVMEIFMRVVGSPISPWKDGWLMGDGFIVFLAVLDVWILGAFQSADVLSTIGAFRAIRMIRAFRALRLIRILRYVRPLRLFAEALSEAFKHISWVMVIALLATWSASVVFTSTVGAQALVDSAEGSVAGELGVAEAASLFGSMGGSMLALNLVLLRGIEWGPRILRPLLFADELQYVVGGVMFVFFVACLLIGFVNVITGAFISSLLEAAQRDTLFMQRKSLTTGEVSLVELKRAFKKFDHNNDGMLKFDDFTRGLEDHPDLCMRIGLHPGKASALFRQLDGNRSGQVTMDEFLVGLLKLTWTSRSIDMLCMDYMQLKMFRDLFRLGQRYDKDFQVIHSSMESVDTDLRKLRGSVQKLSTHLSDGAGLEEAEAIAARTPSKASSPIPAPWSAEDSVLGDLETRFSFKTRLDRLQLSLKKDAQSHAGASPKELWTELLNEELMPWLHARAAVAAAAAYVSDSASATSSSSAESFMLSEGSLLPAVGSQAVASAAAPAVGSQATFSAPAPSAQEPPPAPPPEPERAPSRGFPWSASKPMSTLGWALRPSLLTKVDTASPWYNQNSKS